MDCAGLESVYFLVVFVSLLYYCHFAFAGISFMSLAIIAVQLLLFG